MMLMIAQQQQQHHVPHVRRLFISISKKVLLRRRYKVVRKNFFLVHYAFSGGVCALFTLFRTHIHIFTLRLTD